MSDWEKVDAEVAVKNLMRLPEFHKGKGGPQMMSASTGNLFSRVLRALTNPKIVWGEKDSAEITDSNFVINLSRSSAGGSGGLASIKQYVLIDHSPSNIFTAQAVNGADGSVSGAIVSIAKPFELRQGAFDGKTADVTVEAWDGATFSSSTKHFKFAYQSATYRLASDMDTSVDPPVVLKVEKQTIVPRFIPAVIKDDLVTNKCATLIYAVQCSGMGIDGAMLLALSDGRAWCRSTA